MSERRAEGAERRRHPRFDLFAQVRVKGAHADLVLSLENVSQGGAYVDLGSIPRPPWIAPGRVLELSIVHPETHDLIEVQGSVVRMGASGFAVRFLGVAAEAGRELDQLDALVQYASEKPPAKPPPLPPHGP
ncbi:MAG: PilZ domain-containing protein [Myxococcales bacterium]|nr:PilZ domain-containing protein [Myxococcales bacterium]